LNLAVFPKGHEAKVWRRCFLIQYYCLSCITGKEFPVEERLLESGVQVLPVKRDQWFSKLGKRVLKKVPLIPGYVFLQGEEEPEWQNIRQVKDVITPLHYSDGSTAFKGADLDFIKYVVVHKNHFEISKAIVENGKVKIRSGPLVDYEGKVAFVNKQRRVAKVVLSANSILGQIWLPFDLLENI
jgi:transcription antitermination factor NusG